MVDGLASDDLLGVASCEESTEAGDIVLMVIAGLVMKLMFVPKFVPVQRWLWLVLVGCGIMMMIQAGE